MKTMVIDASITVVRLLFLTLMLESWDLLRPLFIIELFFRIRELCSLFIFVFSVDWILQEEFPAYVL